MIRTAFITFVTLLFFFNVYSQKTFLVGKESYNIGYTSRQYLYEYSFKDSFRVNIIDSIIIFSSSDSLIVSENNYPIGGNNIYKTITYLNRKKDPLKIEEYNGNSLLNIIEWNYDNETGRKILYTEENKSKNINRKETYEYSYDKINGDLIIFVTAFKDGKIEYYSKEYYDKNMRKYKEVRLNDNKKDVMHTELFTYNEQGKLMERYVHFNEFNVTKVFKEDMGFGPSKCFKLLPLLLTERVTTQTQKAFLKKFLAKNQVLILDKDCVDFEYTFKSFNCDIVVKSDAKKNSKQIKIIIRERLR